MFFFFNFKVVLLSALLILLRFDKIGLMAVCDYSGRLVIIIILVVAVRYFVLL